MRSNHWEYLAFVLFALGLALTISGLIIYVHYQQYPQRKPQYSGIQIPLLIVGICLIVLGLPALHKSRTKKRAEELPPPPPPPPPPPLPP